MPRAGLHPSSRIKDSSAINGPETPGRQGPLPRLPPGRQSRRQGERLTFLIFLYSCRICPRVVCKKDREGESALTPRRARWSGPCSLTTQDLHGHWSLPALGQ